jgi:putative MATE family efflux protein
MNDVLEMGRAPIGRLLLKFSLPTIAMMLVNGLYNMIDRIFIGQGMGTEGIAAVTAAYPVMLLSIAIGLLFGVGSSTLISVALGAGRRNEANRALAQAFHASTISSILVAAVSFILMDDVLRLFGTTPALMPLAREYLSIILLGFLFQIPSMAIGPSLRAQGRPNAAVATVGAGVLINAALAPLFIFAFHWGLRGAAWATVIAQASVLAYTLVLIQDGRNMVRLHRGGMRPHAPTLGRMMAIGAPAAVVNAMATAVLGVANASISAYGGGLGIAVVGIVNTVGMLFGFPIMGIAQGAQALWGYNYGMHSHARVRSVTRLALLWSTGFSILFTGVIELFPRVLVTVFNTKDPSLVYLGAHGLSIFCMSFFLFGLIAVSAQFFQSIGKPAGTAILLIARNSLLIAGMLILPRWLALDGVLWAGPVSDGVAAILSAVLLIAGTRGLRRPTEAPRAEAVGVG